MKRWLHLAGGALGLIAFGYVVQRLYSYAGQIDVTRLQARDWVAMGLLSLLYGVANVLLALAWKHLLAVFGVKVDRTWAIHLYGVSQLAKYVPGNVFQFAGRQALGMAEGIAARPLAKSTLWELGLIAVAGSVFSLLALPLVWPRVEPSMAALLAVGAGVFLAYALRHALSANAALAWWLQLAFLAISGAVFVVTLALIIPPHQAVPPLLPVAGAYVAAWLIGLITPGAPAGVGIREAVLLFVLGHIVVPTDLLLAVLLGRLITVMGDLLFFLLSFWVKPPSIE